MAKTTKNDKDESIEKILWKATDKLRKNIDAAEYKRGALKLIFLKCTEIILQNLAKVMI